MKELSIRVVFSGEGLNARRWVIGFLARSRLHASISTTREHRRASQRSIPLPSRLPRRVNVRGRGFLGACLRALTRLEEGANGDDDGGEHHRREDDRWHAAAQHGKEGPEESTEQREH